MLDYPPEKLWPIYEKLPKDLQEAIFSEETADIISSICDRNGVKDEEIPEITKYTGYVLLGILPPDDFPKTLQDEVKLKNDLANKIALEIERLVFFPVKESLEMIYKIEISPELKPSPGVTPVKKPKKDIYRESIE